VDNRVNEDGRDVEGVMRDVEDEGRIWMRRGSGAVEPAGRMGGVYEEARMRG
jgi:hypothetical protein